MASGGDGGAVTISGGVVTANGGALAAGIGGGHVGHGGTTTITGGTVSAHGPSTGAGIGGGSAGPGGTITISGGSVTATSGGGAGIGSGWASPTGPTVTIDAGTVLAEGTAGIGAGTGGAGGTVEVNGGTVTATSAPLGAAIGAGPDGTGAVVTIGETAAVTTRGGFAFGPSQTDWGSVTNDGSLTIGADSTLAVPAGVTLTNDGTIVNDGAVTGQGTVANGGIVRGGGPIANEGLGAPGISITGNNFAIGFDLARGGSGAPPAALARFYAPRLDAASQSLPTPTLAAGATFTGWYTAAAGGTRITETTDLQPALGAGPRTATLYAHYIPPAPTPPRAVVDPSLTALTKGKHGSRTSWYSGPVTIRFDCTVGSAPLTAPCPDPVVLRRNGTHRPVVRTITATDGGTDTVRIHGLKIDRQKPGLRVGRDGGAVQCHGTDRHSGIRSCTVRTHATPTATGTRVTWTATATDRAGNTRTETGSYQRRTVAVAGAPLRDGRFQVVTGSSYRLVVTSPNRPTYYNAEVAPRRPHVPGPAMQPIGDGRWAITIHIDPTMTGLDWNAGIRTGGHLRLIPLRVGD